MARKHRWVTLNGKLTRVALFRRDEHWGDTTAFYLEHDTPTPSLFIKAWPMLPFILLQLDRSERPIS